MHIYVQSLCAFIFVTLNIYLFIMRFCSYNYKCQEVTICDVQARDRLQEASAVTQSGSEYPRTSNSFPRAGESVCCRPRNASQRKFPLIHGSACTHLC